MAMCEFLRCSTWAELWLIAVIMAANSGGLVGSQLLRGDDAPLYKRGFTVCVCLLSFALAVAILQHIQYRLTNRRLTKGEKEDVERSSGLVMGFRHTL